MGCPCPYAVAAAWSKKWSSTHKKVFYYNSITKKTTWDHPKVCLEEQPPSPPPPKPKIREQDQWCKIDDGEGEGKMIWYHPNTKARQYSVPECRVKYKKHCR